MENQYFIDMFLITGRSL